MNIFLIRHTEVAVGREICYGSSDIDLADSFEDDKLKVEARLLPLVQNPVFFSSPLNRCRQLAEYLHTSVEKNHATPLPSIEWDNRLKEIYMGSWEMLPWKKIKLNQLETWGNEFPNKKPPNGESYQDLQDRVSSFWIEKFQNRSQVKATSLVEAVKNHIDKKPLLDPISDNDYVIVTHGGVVRSLVSAILGLPLELSFALEPAKGGITGIEVSSLGQRLLFFNK